MLRKIPKLCVDCKHYLGLGCRKYYDMDVVNGEKTYYYARAVRESEKKCGPEAIHFEKNKYNAVTLPYYFVENNKLHFILFGGTFSYMYILFYLSTS